MDETVRTNAEQAKETRKNELRPFPACYPGGITPDTLFDARTERIIAARADKMIATGLFEQHERDDVANQLRVILAYEMTGYNPARDRYVFAATILARRGVNEIIRRRKELRDNPRPVSLDCPVNGESGETFADLLSAEDHAAFWKGNRTEEELNSLEKDVIGLISSLDRTDQDICRMIMEGKSIREIASELGLTHTGIRYHISNFIAPAARFRGLGNSGEKD